MDVSGLYGEHVMQCWAAQSGYAPIEVDKTEGCWIHTKDGRKIFDLRSAHECINLGFNHPEVLAGIKKYLEEGVVYVTDDFATSPTAGLSKKLSELAPGSDDKKIWFTQSGASAVEGAIKAARLYKYNQLMEEREGFSESKQYPYPYKIISRYRSWHGSSMGALSAGGDPRKWFSEPITVPGFVHAPDAYPYRSPFGEDPDGLKAADYLRYMVEMEGGRDFIAAIMIEPVVGSNGIIPAPKPYMQKVKEICDEFDLLLIVDETMTGMGRTGKFLAIEHYGIDPDIIIMGKALGVYVPLAATIFSEKVARSFEHNIFGHGQSFSGHAFACEAARLSVEVLEQNVLPDVEAKGKYLSEKLHELSSRFSSVGDVRGMGLMWTMELVKNRESRESFRKFNEKYKVTPVKKLSEFLLNERNVYVPGDKFGLWIVPPLIVSYEEIDWLIVQLEAGLVYFEEIIGRE